LKFEGSGGVDPDVYWNYFDLKRMVCDEEFLAKPDMAAMAAPLIKVIRCEQASLYRRGRLKTILKHIEHAACVLVGLIHILLLDCNNKKFFDILCSRRPFTVDGKLCSLHPDLGPQVFCLFWDPHHHGWTTSLAFTTHIHEFAAITEAEMTRVRPDFGSPAFLSTDMYCVWVFANGDNAQNLPSPLPKFEDPWTAEELRDLFQEGPLMVDANEVMSAEQ